MTGDAIEGFFSCAPESSSVRRSVIRLFFALLAASAFPAFAVNLGFNQTCPAGASCNYTGAPGSASGTISCAGGKILTTAANYFTNSVGQSCAQYLGGNGCTGHQSCLVTLSSSTCTGSAPFPAVAAANGGAISIDCLTGPLASTGTVVGNIEGVVNGAVQGWACQVGDNSPISVQLYAINGYPQGEFIANFTANAKSEPAILTACGASGGNYRFSIPLTQEWLAHFSGAGVYVHGIDPVPGNNPLLSNSGTYTFPPASAPNTCLATDVTSFNNCSNTATNVVVELQNDITCSGAGCCSNSNSASVMTSSVPWLNVNRSNFVLVNGNGHTLHRLADPTTGIGYEAQCPALTVTGSNYVRILALNLDEDETVPACTVAPPAPIWPFNCAQTVLVKNSGNVDFEGFGLYNAKGYGMNAVNSNAVIFDTSVISNTGVIGFYAGNSTFTTVTNSIIARTGANGVAFVGVGGYNYGANTIAGNVFNANHYRGAWPAAQEGSLISGGQIYLPEINFVNVQNNVIADGSCSGCAASEYEAWGMELGGGSPPTVNYLETSGNYLYNGYGLPFFLNAGSQFSGVSFLGGNPLSPQPADTIDGFTGNAGNYPNQPNLANFGAAPGLTVDDSVSNVTATLNRGGYSDYTIYRLGLLKSPKMHLEANSANDGGTQTSATSVLEYTFGLSPSPRVGANPNPIYRCFVGASTVADFASFDPNCGGTQRSFHSILGYSYALSSSTASGCADAGAVRMYSCLNTNINNDYFVSWDPKCESQIVVQPLGCGIPYKYLTPIATYTQGEQIETNHPNTWQIPNLTYTISPTLPAGLSMSPTTGVITGTPAMGVSGSSLTYTVNATGAGTIQNQFNGVIQMSLQIRVNPALVYSTGTLVYTLTADKTMLPSAPPATDVPLAAVAPAFVSYSASTSLPYGLSLNGATGQISPPANWNTIAVSTTPISVTINAYAREGHTSSETLQIFGSTTATAK